MDAESLQRVEAQRLELESNVAALRKSLRYWQTIEIDYEGLKEEYQGLPEIASPQRCRQAAEDFAPEIIADAELQDILRDKSSGPRKPSQLIEILTKRSEYVLRNIATIRKQISDAEKKRNVLLLVENPEFQDDAGLPLKEITEELDDDGEVISGRVQAPAENANNLVDVLRKAGVTDLGTDDNHTNNSTKDPIETKPTPQANHIATDLITQSEVRAALPYNASLDNTSNLESISVNETQDSEQNDNDATRAVALGPTNPNDTEEDAQLRQEMLEYGLDEVGAIVAELDMRENSSDIDIDDYMKDLSDIDDEDEDEDEDLDMDDDEDSEDERGASRSSLMSDRYVRRMETLQKKLGLQGMQNTGPDTAVASENDAFDRSGSERPSAAEAARKAALARANEAGRTKSSLEKTVNHEDDNNDPTNDKQKAKPRQKKVVAFATDLDIADEADIKPTATNVSHNNDSTVKHPEVNPLRETVIEKPTTSSSSHPTLPSAPLPQSSNPQTTSTRKPSRFKASLSSSPSTSTPNPPPNATHASTLVERPAPQTPSAPDSTDFDTALHARDIALEYQRHRNRRIHLQGGYVGGGEEDNWGDERQAVFEVGDARPDVGDGGETGGGESGAGRTRKVSRFKAARVKMDPEMEK